MGRKKTFTTGKAVLVAGIISAIIAGTIGIAIYLNRVRPFRTTVIEVNGSQIRMGYFLKRAAMSGGNSMKLLEILTKEEIIKQVAAKPPYDISLPNRKSTNFSGNWLVEKAKRSTKASTGNGIASNLTKAGYQTQSTVI